MYVYIYKNINKKKNAHNTQYLTGALKGNKLTIYRQYAE